jgi:amino acid transporter
LSEVYKKGSLSLLGAIGMGTGVMIGAGIFALTGQVAELGGALFPLAFLFAAVISGFSAYSYIKVSSKYPSAGGIAMILKKSYGTTTITGAGALLMALSMIINESLVARTFGTYTVRLLDVDVDGASVPLLAVGLIILAFLGNLAGNQFIGTVSKITALLKIGGIVLLSGAVLYASGFSFEATTSVAEQSTTVGGFLAAVAIGILAYKGFTTITNSGGEMKNPERNMGRAIVVSLAICFVVYVLVSLAVKSALPLDEIVRAKNYSLAQASRPAFGELGQGITIAIAIIATSSGVLASVFAVSRMLTMLTDMKFIPHRHFRMPGNIQKHMLVYTVLLAGLLAAFFDLTRIASLGAILYLVVDIAVHWGIFRHLREDVGARAAILVSAIILDVLVLGAFLALKGANDPLVVVVAIAAIGAVLVFEHFYLRRVREDEAPLVEHMH